MLLRADLDTFPTPRLLGNWPAGVLVDRGYYTNHGLESIKRALQEFACSAGIQHRGWCVQGDSDNIFHVYTLGSMLAPRGTALAGGKARIHFENRDKTRLFFA